MTSGWRRCAPRASSSPTAGDLHPSRHRRGNPAADHHASASATADLAADALDWLDDPKARLLVNERSGRAAVQVPATSVMLDDGEIERRVRLIRPMEAAHVPCAA
jgi:hypothetical protein